MHRAEDDDAVRESSPEFTDQPAVVHDRGRDPAPSTSESSGGSSSLAAASEAVNEDPKNGEANPSHDTHKSPEEHPRGLGDGELMEQPDSVTEAREPGPQ